MHRIVLLFALALSALRAETIQTDLLIVGADESGCAAAVQAARLGVKRIVLVNDIQWLGGQFATQGIGPMDEWTVVEGRRVNFPRSGAFLEIIDRIRAHNRRAYGVATPGNAWCGTDTIEPAAAARIFEDWLAPYASQIRILRPWEPIEVRVKGEHVTGVVFARSDTPAERMEVQAAITMDSSDWGDVIRLSGAAFSAGPDLRSRYGEPSAPERLETDGHQEMNPISWCPFLRETDRDALIQGPPRYDARSFSDMRKVPPWRDWDGSGGIYNFAGWCVYTHRRIVDRRHFGLNAGTEAVVLNWPSHDYPLCTLPQHVADALEATEPGASKKNIVTMTPTQRRIVFADAKQRALEFLHYLQTAPGGEIFRAMQLTDEYGTPDRLPPKPYIREGLRLDALYVLREQDVRTESHTPLWARSMVPDGVFGYQFNMDFHPTRRKFVGDDRSQPWRGLHVGTRNWSADTDRAMFPLRGLVPVRMNGLLGASKNIGVTSMVQSSLRLHGQMMHVGTAAATVAWLCLRDGVQPREVAASPASVREVQRRLVRGAGGPGTLIWPWHDAPPEESWFEAANMLALAGIWQPDADSVRFSPERNVTHGELSGVLVRLCRAIAAEREWPALPSAPPDELARWGTLHRWLTALGFPASDTLLVKRPGDDHATRTLTRAECVDYLYRLLQARGESLPPSLAFSGDTDGDGRPDLDDPLPHNRDK